MRQRYHMYRNGTTCTETVPLVPCYSAELYHRLRLIQMFAKTERRKKKDKVLTLLLKGEQRCSPPSAVTNPRIFSLRSKILPDIICQGSEPLLSLTLCTKKKGITCG